MWIAGLAAFVAKAVATSAHPVHLHTQYNREIPWAEIDLDCMNLNQLAHGDREFGFIGSRMRLRRKVVVRYWQDEDVQASLAAGARAACAWHDWQGAKDARFGDNMREVAVTEGDKKVVLRVGCGTVWKWSYSQTESKPKLEPGHDGKGSQVIGCPFCCVIFLFWLLRIHSTRQPCS